MPIRIGFAANQRLWIKIYHNISSGMITLTYRWLTRIINLKDLLLIWKSNCLIPMRPQKKARIGIINKFMKAQKLYQKRGGSNHPESWLLRLQIYPLQGCSPAKLYFCLMCVAMIKLKVEHTKKTSKKTDLFLTYTPNIQLHSFYWERENAIRI